MLCVSTLKLYMMAVLKTEKFSRVTIICRYTMIAAMVAVPPLDAAGPHLPNLTLQQRGSTATFLDNAALFPAWLITYRTPEVVSYY